MVTLLGSEAAASAGSAKRVHHRGLAGEGGAHTRSVSATWPGRYRRDCGVRAAAKPEAVSGSRWCEAAGALLGKAGLRGEVIEVGLRRQRIAAGAGGVAHHRHGRFGLALVEAGIAKAFRGGAGVEGGGAQGVRGVYPHGPAGWAMASASRRSMPAGVGARDRVCRRASLAAGGLDAIAALGSPGDGLAGIRGGLARRARGARSRKGTVSPGI